MSQSRKHSAIEAIVGSVVGYVFSLGLQYVGFWMFGMTAPSHAAHLGFGLLFAVASPIRVYGIRRLFNWAHASGRL